jgi:hypothetical protein
MNVVAKFRVNAKAPNTMNPDTGTVNLNPVYSTDPLERENCIFGQSTPNGALMMQLDNPEAFAAFNVGDEHYLVFMPAGATKLGDMTTWLDGAADDFAARLEGQIQDFATTLTGAASEAMAACTNTLSNLVDSLKADAAGTPPVGTVTNLDGSPVERDANGFIVPGVIDWGPDGPTAAQQAASDEMAAAVALAPLSADMAITQGIAPEAVTDATKSEGPSSPEPVSAAPASGGQDATVEPTTDASAPVTPAPVTPPLGEAAPAAVLEAPVPTVDQVLAERVTLPTHDATEATPAVDPTLAVPSPPAPVASFAAASTGPVDAVSATDALASTDAPTGDLAPHPAPAVSAASPADVPAVEPATPSTEIAPPLPALDVATSEPAAPAPVTASATAAPVAGPSPDATPPVAG